MTGKIIFTGRVLANDYVSLREWILSIHPGLIGWAANNQDIKIVFNGNEYFIFKGDSALHIDDNTGFVIVATTDGKNLVAGKNPVYQIPGDQKIYFQNNFNDATNRVVVNSIREESMVLDKPFEIRRFFHNNRQLDYSMMSTLLKDYDNAYGAKRAPAPDLDWRDLNEINGDLKFEVLECEDASFVGEYKIDKTGGNGHQSYWFAGGEPNIATKHALFKLKKKQQDGTYAPTDYEVGCTASDGAGEGWWPEAITPATRKDHWVIRINGGASGVVSSCKFTRVVNPTNQVKFTKDNYITIIGQEIVITPQGWNDFMLKTLKSSFNIDVPIGWTDTSRWIDVYLYINNEIYVIDKNVNSVYNGNGLEQMNVIRVMRKSDGLKRWIGYVGAGEGYDWHPLINNRNKVMLIGESYSTTTDVNEVLTLSFTP